MTTRHLLLLSMLLTLGASGCDTRAEPTGPTLLDQTPPNLSRHDGPAVVTGFFDLGKLPGHQSSSARAVNELGLVVGSSAAPPGLILDRIPMTVRQGGDMGAIDFGDAGEAYDVNDSGIVVGAAVEFEPARAGAFRWTEAEGAMPLSGVTSAYGVNNRGQIVGRAAGGACGPHQEAVVWEEGHISCLGRLGGTQSIARAINEVGIVVGSFRDAEDETKAFRWIEGEGMTEIPGRPGLRTIAQDVNDLGEVVGALTQGLGDDFTSTAVVWDATGRIRDLGLFDARTSARAINNRGDVVGNVISPEGVSRAVMWTAEGDVLDLGAASGAPWSAAQDLNDGGVVIGYVGPSVQASRAAMWTVDLPAPSAAGVVSRTLAALDHYVVAGVLEPEEAQPLRQVLTAAASATERGNDTAAARQIQAVVNMLEAAVRSGRMTAEAARPLTSVLASSVGG